MNGFTDKPVTTVGEDIFEVRQYITGLNEFILECNTPMTIAIQGDWGSGKTSMMNMIREELGDRVATSWFNTWQYSQFNMGDSLAVSFLSRLVADLGVDENQKDAKFQKVLKTIARFARNAGVIVVDSTVGGKAAEALQNGFQTAEQGEVDMPQAINELKEQFQTAVDSKIARSGKDRLVVFIDDLDRLHPGKAVELLEVLKLFLDCDNCVFVLAIDYAVVSQGVKQKYGELIGEEKGRSFFDKIIQVPFKMPVAQYNVRNYVTNALQSLGMETSPSEIDTYVRLIQTSVGCNPRAMKRLFNAFLLLNKVAKKGTITGSRQRKILFAILCLQLSFESIYNYIVANPDECYDGALLGALAAADTYNEGEETDRLSRELNLHTDAEIVKAVEFMAVFNGVLDRDGNGALSEEEIDEFINILGISTITASTAPESVSENKLESSYRYYNRDIVKELLPIIGAECGQQFRLYQSRTNNNPNWRKHYASGVGTVPCAFGKIGVQFKISTNLQSKESDLSIWIYPDGRTDRYRFVEQLKEWCDSQSFGFVYLESDCGFWLNTKTVNADSRDEIIRYFAETVPAVVMSIAASL